MQQNAQILFIDDESGSRESLSLLLKREGYEVDAVAAGEEAIKRLSRKTYDAIITDLFLPGVSGIDILKHVKEQNFSCNVILITGNAKAETAVEAMKEGAFDYIVKPVDFEKLKTLISKAVEKSRLVAENLYLRQQLRGKYKFDNIIGNSQSIQPVFTRMEKILHTDSTVLILGESGTGKELVAKAIHYNGPRKEKPFVAINCGAIPADLLESELFGHVRGSFTGAVADKPGKFEIANRGTIFLDEIGNMPLHLQMKLLRALQEQEVERVGSTRRTKLDVRVISATNVDLEDRVRRGEFREDLFYRLNVIPIQLPPLRDRREDIALLARHFLRKTCEEMHRPLLEITREAIIAMESYEWPGNVREMENVIERAVALTDSAAIDVQDLPAQFGRSFQTAGSLPSLHIPDEGLDLPDTVAQLEQDLIKQALERTKHVKAKAAELLNINRTTPIEKIKRYGMN